MNRFKRLVIALLLIFSGFAWTALSVLFGAVAVAVWVEARLEARASPASARPRAVLCAALDLPERTRLRPSDWTVVSAPNPPALAISAEYADLLGGVGLEVSLKQGQWVTWTAVERLDVYALDRVRLGPEVDAPAEWPDPLGELPGPGEREPLARRLLSQADALGTTEVPYDQLVRGAALYRWVIAFGENGVTGLDVDRARRRARAFLSAASDLAVALRREHAAGSDSGEWDRAVWAAASLRRLYPTVPADAPPWERTGFSASAAQILPWLDRTLANKPPTAWSDLGNALSQVEVVVTRRRIWPGEVLRLALLRKGVRPRGSMESDTIRAGDVQGALGCRLVRQVAPGTALTWRDLASPGK